MHLPKVSVIIPCFNSADFVGDALRSVLAQRYNNLEIIVVDDGSTDNTLQVLQPFAEQIKLIQQQNQGAASARNMGVLTASGDYIAFLDSDDVWLEEKLINQVSTLQQSPEYGLCFCNWDVWSTTFSLQDMIAKHKQQNDLKEIDETSSGWLYLPLLEESIIHTSTALIRRDIFNDVGLFDTNYPIGEDYDFWLRIARKYRMIKLAGVYTLYRDTPQSITKNVHEQNFNLKVIQSASERFGLVCPSGKSISTEKLKKLVGARHFDYGYNAMIKGRRDKAQSAFQGCIACRYKLYKASLFWFICIVPPIYTMFLRHKHAKTPKMK